MKEPYRLRPVVRARIALADAERSGNEIAIAAKRARVNYHAGMIPQRGSYHAIWAAWHRESGLDGFGNRTARKHAARSISSARKDVAQFVRDFFGVEITNVEITNVAKPKTIAPADHTFPDSVWP